MAEVPGRQEPRFSFGKNAQFRREGVGCYGCVVAVQFGSAVRRAERKWSYEEYLTMPTTTKPSP